MNMKLANGLLGLCALLIAGQVSAATVSLTPSVATVQVNDAFTLTVQGTDFVNDVSSGSINVTWDVTAMTMTSTLADIAASAALNGFPIDFFVNSLTPGSLSATFGTFGSVAGPTFDFLSMDFLAIPPPSSTVLDIFAGSFGDWQDGASEVITPVAYVGAQVTVDPIPIPAAAWLFGTGLIGFVGIARRRKVRLA